MSTPEFAAATATAEAESPPRLSPPTQWSLFWRRFKRDRFALISGVVLLLLLLACFVLEPILERVLGHGPNEIFPTATNFAAKPVGPWSWVVDSTSSAAETTDKTLFVLGGDGSLGRDEFLRLLKGGQASLTIGLGSALLAVLIGVPLGALAGLLGGRTDALVSRMTEFFMGFPILLLFVAMSWSVRQRVEELTLGGVFVPGVVALTLLIGAFTWFYPARISRATVLQLQRQEFVEASRMIGASSWRIVYSHMFPHLVGPIATYFAIIAAANIVLESAISFLNIGIPLPDASWGNMLATNWGHFFIVDRPSVRGVVTTWWTTFWPAAAIALTVLCLTLFAEGVRRAVDPGSTR
jgi:peptide/nickel transport system permease protein